MLIEPARVEDFTAYSSLFVEVNNFHVSAHPEVFQVVEPAPRSLDEYQVILADPAQAILIAWADGLAAGFIHILLRDSPPNPVMVPRRFGVVDVVVVGGQFKRQGIGQALMAKGERWARERGATSIELGVFEFNQGAIQFYEELGFSTVSRKMRKLF
jgi:diamine N-acetyltransferase